MSQSTIMDTLWVARDARLEGNLEQEAEILATVEVEFEHRKPSKIRGYNWEYCWTDEPQTPEERYGEVGGSLLGPRRKVLQQSMRLGRRQL